ncbi:GON-4-like protein [Anoplopoma fimbria]|uniref:GON-4-like protein n=1 Tax=Anoplopoma fimbria TaxID=229290 RepID=UPI0023EBC18B|nr:GON-4-like protein [Anoplopoma fimbria]
MEGSCDPTKLVSQFLLRKTLVQVRRRILQCCRPGSPDNIVKAFRYQRVLGPMLLACRQVDPEEQRPPVEREEEVMPLWLLLPPGPGTPPASPNTLTSDASALCCSSPSPVTPPPDSSPVTVSQLGSSPVTGSQLGSSPVTGSQLGSSPVTDRQLRSSPITDRQLGSSPVTDSQLGSSPPPQALSPPRVLLRRLLLSRTDSPADITTSSNVSMAIRERIRRHYRTLTSLRKRKSSSSPPENGGGARRGDEGHAPSQGEVQEGDDEEESEVLLVLSESSPSSTGNDVPEEAESEREQEVTSTSTADNDDDDDDDEGETSSDDSFLLLKEASGDGEDEGDGDQRQTEDEEVFAADYLLRVCEAVQVSPGVSEQLLQVLDGSWSSVELLFGGLRRVLRPWPQLLRDFAAFLNRRQARRCGLLAEQQLFERSRRFLRRLGRSLGEGSAPFKQVVSVLQGSSAPTPEDMVKISSLLRCHSDLQEEFWEFFQQLHGSETDYVSHNPPLHGNRKKAEGAESEEAEEAESERPVGAKNVSMTTTGEKVVEWTREADRAILTACQQRGANRKTFRQVSSQLGNKTAQQVSLRFSDLMTLFHSANLQKSTSCSSEGQPISRQEAARD